MKMILNLVRIVSSVTVLASCAMPSIVEEAPFANSPTAAEKPEWSVGYRQMSLNKLTGKEAAWEIISIDDEGSVTAKSDDRCEWTVPGEWFAGVERWTGCGGTDGIRKVLKSEGILWPLEVGKRSRYSYQLQMADGGSRNEIVKCEVVS